MGKIFDKLSDDWKDIKEIVIYGFGKIAQGNIGWFCDHFKIKCIIDNNPDYMDVKYKGIPIINYEHYKQIGGGQKQNYSIGRR